MDYRRRKSILRPQQSRPSTLAASQRNGCATVDVIPTGDCSICTAAAMSRQPRRDTGRLWKYCHAWSGLSILVPDYGRGPEHPFPAAVNDASAAFAWMQKHAADGRRDAAKTFMAGDSAGRKLDARYDARPTGCQQTPPQMRRLRFQHTPTSHTPANPCADRAGIDPRCASQLWHSCYADNYLCGADPRNPLASPIYGDPSGLPPLPGPGRGRRSHSRRLHSVLQKRRRHAA